MNWTWIPQLFSDLLGRIIPGAAFMVVSLLVVVGPIPGIEGLMFRPAEAKIFSLGTALLFLLFSYLIGFIMGQLWITFLGKGAEKSEWEANLECRAQCLAEHNKLQAALGMSPVALDASDLPRTFVMHDHLRLVAGAEAQRLLKLRSEKRLCHVIVLGFLLLVVLNSGYMATLCFRGECGMDRVVLEVFLIGSIFSCWKRSLRLERQFVNGTCIAWLSFASAKKLLFQTDVTDAGKAASKEERPPSSGLQTDGSATA